MANFDGLDAVLSVIRCLSRSADKNIRAQTNIFFRPFQNFKRLTKQNIFAFGEAIINFEVLTK